MNGLFCPKSLKGLAHTLKEVRLFRYLLFVFVPFRVRAIFFLLPLGSGLHTFSQGTWTQKASFPGSARSGAVGFSIGNKGYIGTGYDTTSFGLEHVATVIGLTKDFWQWDKTTNTWTQIADHPDGGMPGGGVREEAVGFSIGNKGYIGTGFDVHNCSCFAGDFYEYDPPTNTWIQRSLFPCFSGYGSSCRSQAIGFSIGTKGYMGTGNTTGTYSQDFWEFDQATNVWVQKADLPGSVRCEAVGLSVGTKGYIGLGWSGSVFLNDFWEWDQATNVWTQKANYGGTARSRAVAFTIGKKAYVGTGAADTTINRNGFQDFWAWDQNTNVWTQVANFGGGTRYGAVGFSIGYCGYVATGYGGADSYYNPYYHRDLWEYCPNGYCCNTMIVNTTSQFIICNGQCTGTSTAHPSNGILPYSYNWSNGQTTQTATGLCAGTYIVTVTDSVNNTITNTVTVSQSALPLTHSLTPVTNVNCFGNNNGSATINVSGGMPSYTYLWSSVPIQTTPTAAGLGPGNYTVTVTDLYRCSFSDTITITSPPLFTYSFPNITNVDCFGNNNGSASVSAAGGTPSYTYSWNGTPVQTTPAISALYAGVYSVTITDSHGCLLSDTVVIKSPTGLTVIPPVITNANCFGTNTGTATVTATGGTPGYSYSWNPTAQTSSTATGLAASVYTITVTDNNGCIIKTLVPITQPPLLIASISSDTSICFGTSNTENIFASGGTPGYTYLWMPSGGTTTSVNIFPPATTTYTAQVTDANGCLTQLLTTVTVVQNPAASLSYTPDFCSGSVQFTDSSANEHSWNWHFGDGDSASSQNPMHIYSASGLYSVTLLSVVGQLGCKTNSQLQVDVPPFSQQYIPNAFSPNDDGLDDMYYVFGKCIAEMTFKVFDRWGEKVFETSDPAVGWDGRYKGQMENAGVFMYEFNGTLTTGEKINRKGNITLMR